MKKVLVFLIAVIIISCFTACTKTSDSIGSSAFTNSDTTGSVASGDMKTSETDTNLKGDVSAKSSEYIYRHDTWYYYKAVFISGSTIKVEKWEQYYKDDSEPKYKQDVCALNIKDGSTDFEWLDKEKSAFTVTLRDSSNGTWEKETKVGFAIEPAAGEEHTVYEFRNDHNLVYKATLLSDSALIIERWDHYYSSDETPLFESDLCAININDDSTDFKWIDEEKTAFTLTLADPMNGLWKEEKKVGFGIVPSDNSVFPTYEYKHNSISLYKAILLSSSALAIQDWDVSSDPVLDHDVCIINIQDNSTDVKWIDEEQSAFTVTFCDPSNGTLQDPESITFFRQK